MATSASTDKPELVSWEVHRENKFVASVAKVLTYHKIPCVLIGQAYHKIIGIPSKIHTISFAIEDGDLERAGELLDKEGLSRQCKNGSRCRYSQARFCFSTPEPDLLFHVDVVQGRMPLPEAGHLSLFSKDKWLPHIPALNLGPPGDSNSYFILANDRRLPSWCEEHRRARRDGDRVTASKCVCGLIVESEYTGGRYRDNLPPVNILRPARLIETWVRSQFNEWLIEYHRDGEAGDDQGRFWNGLYSFEAYNLWNPSAFEPEYREWWTYVRLTVDWVRGKAAPERRDAAAAAREARVGLQRNREQLMKRLKESEKMLPCIGVSPV